MESFAVRFETSQGDIVVEVYPDWAPKGAERLRELVQEGFFDGARFFRVVEDFVVQFGIAADPKVSAAWRGRRIPDDPVKASNARGTLTFATSGPNTRTTQLFINLRDNPRLDSMGFAPIGKVTEGMEVVDRLYGGYGEGPPQGSGPRQDRIHSEGEAYLSREFSQLDRIQRATIAPPGTPPASGLG